MSERREAGCLLILRLNNFGSIEAAFGEDAAIAAMNHLRRAARHHLGQIDVRRAEGNELELYAHYPVMRCSPVSALVETLCAELACEPFQQGQAAILLSVSAGYAHEGASGADLEARARLAASPLPALLKNGNDHAGRYRKDMESAAGLVRLMRRGATFLTWRPVVRSDDPDLILHHEGTLRRLADRGEQVDCAEAYAALERLGLAHLVDRAMLLDVIDELERDAAACLSVPVSTRSLSPDLHGKHCGWNEIIARLTTDRAVARRLVIEIADNSPIACLRDVVGLIRRLRNLGVRFSVGRFGSGQASIKELMTIAPDMVKLDSSFLHTAYQSDRNRLRLARLLKLARSVSAMVIADGVESPWHLRLAMEEDAEWVAGSHMGRASRRRSGTDARHGGAPASLAAFNSLLPAPLENMRSLAG